MRFGHRRVKFRCSSNVETFRLGSSDSFHEKNPKTSNHPADVALELLFIGRTCVSQSHISENIIIHHIIYKSATLYHFMYINNQTKSVSTVHAEIYPMRLF